MFCLRRDKKENKEEVREMWVVGEHYFDNSLVGEHYFNFNNFLKTKLSDDRRFILLQQIDDVQHQTNHHALALLLSRLQTVTGHEMRPVHQTECMCCGECNRLSLDIHRLWNTWQLILRLVDQHETGNRLFTLLEHLEGAIQYYEYHGWILSSVGYGMKMRYYHKSKTHVSADAVLHNRESD